MATVTPQPTDQAIEEAWSNIATSYIQLAESVQFYQHEYRQTSWLIIADSQNESYFRSNAETRIFLGLLDGSRNVEEAWLESLNNPEFRITKQDIVYLIANLQSAQLLRQPPDIDHSQAIDQKTAGNLWLRPFAIKFSLLDPDTFLKKSQHWVKPLFSPLAFILWLIIIFIALITAWMNSADLLEHSQTRFSDPKNLIWYWLLYPIIKALHELGHAYATRIRGAAVHDMGIMLLVFFPVPYVDSSAAHRFVSKYQRLQVSAAGIMVELLLASLALMVWVNTDAGMVHDMAFDIVIIGGISTLLFNANPLLRFDGYYILQELLEIPNLATRSTQYLGYLIKYYALNIASSRSPVSAKGEVKWLIAYGIGSGIYRVFISIYIALWVAGKFFIVGMSLAIWSLISQLLYPTVKNSLNLIRTAKAEHRLTRLSLSFALISLVALVSLLTPVGNTTYAEGIVKLPQDAYIRAGTDGIITQVLIPDGTSVAAGSVILMMDNIDLTTQKEILQARLTESTARQKSVILNDRKQSETLKARTRLIEAELNDVNDQLKTLSLTSLTAGVVSLSKSEDLPGRYVKRGDVIGYVTNLKQVTAQVVISQAHIDEVRNDTKQIQAILKSRPGEVLSAQFVTEQPQITNQLPSKKLGSGAGGHIAVDARDASGLQALSNIYQLEVSLPLRHGGNYLGQSLILRFTHSQQPLANQLFNWIKREFIDSPFF